MSYQAYGHPSRIASLFFTTTHFVVQLPGLKKVKLTPGQQFYLRLILLTDNDDPSASVFLHANKLEYHSSNTKTLDDGTVCVLISPDEINTEVKR